MSGPLERDHEQLEGLIAADVLDGLDDDDRRELQRALEEHGPDCDRCDQLFAQYSEVAAGLAIALDPLAPSTGAEERLLQAARDSNADPMSFESRRAARRSEPTAPGAGRSRRWVAAVAIAACLAAVGGFVGYSLPHATSVQASFLSFVSQPGTEVAQFPPNDGQTMAVAYRPGETAAWVVGSNLSAPESGHTYQLWYRADPSGPMQPAATFDPVDGDILAPADLGPVIDALAVSVEPDGGSEQPTTAPVFLTTV